MKIKPPHTGASSQKIEASELIILVRRYRRLLQFDRVLWTIYAATALFPIYALFTINHNRIFHIIGIFIIVSVAACGWRTNTRLLNASIDSEVPGYCVTVAFVLSRLAWVPVASYMTFKQYEPMFGETVSLDMMWRGVILIITSPGIAYLVFIFGGYRLVYHVAVHFLLKFRRAKPIRINQ